MKEMLVRPLEERPPTTVLWDTPDLRLARWGCSLSHENGKGWTVHLPDEQGGDARGGHRIAGDDDAVPGAALDLVAAFARTAPLTAWQATGSEAGATLAGASGVAGSSEIAVDDVGRHSTAADVVRRAIAASTVRLIRHDAGVRLGNDPEAVHQARVAVRRLRSDLRTFRPLVAREWGDRLRDELRWIGGELGEVRDADVLVAGLLTGVGQLPESDRAAGDAVIEEVRGHALRSRVRLLESMRSQRYLRLLELLVEASHRPALLPDAERPAAEVLPGLVARPRSRLRRDAGRLRRREAGDDELHALRIRAKRVRYAAEAGAPVIGKAAAKFARAVTGLQDVLGELHDAVVAAAWLREHGPGGPATEAFAAGQLWAIEGEVAAQARSRWPRAWKRARRRKRRRWM